MQIRPHGVLMSEMTQMGHRPDTPRKASLECPDQSLMCIGCSFGDLSSDTIMVEHSKSMLAVGTWSEPYSALLRSSCSISSHRMRLMVHSPSPMQPPLSKILSEYRHRSKSTGFESNNRTELIYSKVEDRLSFWSEISDRINESTGFESFWMNFSVLRVIFRTGPAKMNSIYDHKSLS